MKSSDNITDFADREIRARYQAENASEVTYFFECEDRISLEAVTFRLRGGRVTERVLVPWDEPTMSNDINGSAVPGYPYSGSRS